MDPREIEFKSLVGWLRTFALQSEASTAAELSDGLAMAEALVQIEPAVFTPTWFAGILKSNNSNNENLNQILNLLLHFYRQNLEDVCISGELPIPEIPSGVQDLSKEMAARFLKLMLGVAVTCSNKLLFINKIQSLDETTQHALTSCVASFIFTKEWMGKTSNHSQNTEIKMSTPPGDEVWKQKCHELDFQVALLKDERSNLINENEELYTKVKSAQHLSRRDSIKSRQVESEINNIKDEFERLKLAYEGTRNKVDNIELKMKPGDREQTQVMQLTEETNFLKAELAKLKASLSAKENGGKWGSGAEEEEILQRLDEQQEMIVEMRSMIEYQAGLGREVECLKDQVDVLREQGQKFDRYEQELVNIRKKIQDFQMEKDDMVEIVRQNQNMTLMSVDSETCLDSHESSLVVMPNDSLSSRPTSLSVSQSYNNLEETFVVPVQRSQEDLRITLKEDERVKSVVNKSNEHLLMKEELRHVQANTSEISPEFTNSLDHLRMNETEIEGKADDDNNTKQIHPENFIEKASLSSSRSQDSEPTHEAVEHLLRVISDPNLDIKIEDIEGTLKKPREVSTSDDNLTEVNDEFSQASNLIEKPPDQLFDPNDPKVKELEEWNCSMDRSFIEEESPRVKGMNVFKMKKMNKSRDKSLHGEEDVHEEEGMTMDCFNSWMLQIFVKVFD